MQFPAAEECTQDPTGLPEHSRPLEEGYSRRFGVELELSCVYGYKKTDVLELTCLKENGDLKWEVCGQCDCMINSVLAFQ